MSAKAKAAKAQRKARGTKPKASKTVRMIMDTFLRQLATSFKNNGSKIVTIIKYQEELGPEWTTKVIASLDDIIREFQCLRQALEAGSGSHRSYVDPRNRDKKKAQR